MERTAGSGTSTFLRESDIHTFILQEPSHYVDDDFIWEFADQAAVQPQVKLVSPRLYAVFTNINVCRSVSKLSSSSSRCSSSPTTVSRDGWLGPCCATLLFAPPRYMYLT